MGRLTKQGFKSNKFGAIRQTYNGYSYDSKLEARYAAKLDWMLKAGEITKWDRQVKLSLDVNGHHICNYYVDFLVLFPDGREEFHEVKGAETNVWRIKWALSHALYPNYNFVLIKEVRG